MRIAEVSVNLKSLPDKKTLIEMALKSTKFIKMHKDKALPLINQEIKDSGLFKTITKRVSKAKKSD